MLGISDTNRLLNDIDMTYMACTGIMFILFSRLFCLYLFLVIIGLVQRN